MKDPDLMEANVVELLHLSRLVGSLYILDEVVMLRTYSQRLYAHIKHMGFDLPRVLSALERRSSEEQEAFQTSAAAKRTYSSRRTPTH